jgi:surfactin synthase thioesterase subunit
MTNTIAEFSEAQLDAAEAPLLVCFHHAGGAASGFRRWRKALPDGARLHAVQLPGRENRYHDQRHVTLDTLVDAMADELADVLDQPHVLFGHSMGALIAYYLTQRRLAAGLRAPEALLVAAYASPDRAKASFLVDDLDDRAFGEALHSIGGLRDELLVRPEWLRPILSVVRDDIKVCNSHDYRPLPPLPAPIHAFGGRSDPLVDERDLVSWAAHTTSTFELTMLDAGHFMVAEPDCGIMEGVFAAAGLR